MWKDIKGFEGIYQISDSGEVRSLPRYFKNHSKLQFLQGRILKPCICGKGYYRVCLCKDGVVHEVYIHRLVAEHYINNTNNCAVVNHIDGNKLNNKVDNLEWLTYSQNNQHAYDTSLKARGAGYYNSKLSEQDVREILINGKYTTYQNIANKYNVSKATVRDVLNRKTWKYIEV